MNSSRRDTKQVNGKKHPVVGMNLEQMIEAGYLVPAGEMTEKGKLYITVDTHEEKCQISNGGDTCICREVKAEMWEYVPEGKVDALEF